MTRTFLPITSFVSSPETEKERLLYATHSVASGFYSRHGYLILPKRIPEYTSYCIVIPPFMREVSLKYWQDAAKFGVLMPKIITPRMRREIKNIQLTPVDKEILKQIESKWKKIEKDTWNALNTYFPGEIKWIKSLEVRVTKLGPAGSHYLLKKAWGQHLIIYLRQDTDFHEIVNLLVLALIYPYESEFGLSFTHRQTLRNFIFSRKEFKKIYPDFSPKTYDNPKIPMALKRKSEEYINFLGIPGLTDPIKELNSNINLFGAKEANLINLLISKKPEICNYDAIADAIWGAGEFKSYWAINKLIQRIQGKIDKLKINLKIKGVRGRGYYID
jgi:hypothetical protein